MNPAMLPQLIAALQGGGQQQQQMPQQSSLGNGPVGPIGTIAPPAMTQPMMPQPPDGQTPYA